MKLSTKYELVQQDEDSTAISSCICDTDSAQRSVA